MIKRTLTLLILLPLLAGGATALGGWSGESATDGGSPSPAPTQALAPDFAFVDINPASASHGETLALEQLRAERGLVLQFVASWCKRDRGLGIGLLVAAIALGKSVPHLLNGLPGFGDGGMPPWRPVLIATSVFAWIDGADRATDVGSAITDAFAKAGHDSDSWNGPVGGCGAALLDTA